MLCEEDEIWLFKGSENSFPVKVIWSLSENMACQHPLIVLAEKMGSSPSGPAYTLVPLCGPAAEPGLGSSRKQELSLPA